jgi:hypothetical protein
MVWPPPAPLRDESAGRLKGWPCRCTIVFGTRVFHTFRPARDDEPPAAIVRRVSGAGRWIYCDYCDAHVLPLALDELPAGFAPTRMLICAHCGAGLTSPTVRH